MHEVCKLQKEVILLGERVVLATLGFYLYLHDPYTPLGEATNKFKVTHYALVQLAWSVVNDGYDKLLVLYALPSNPWSMTRKAETNARPSHRRMEALL